MWFLRCLKEREDLARFRFGSMTAGINDVTVKKAIGQTPAGAAPVLKALKANAYDPRIPRMVACFVSDDVRSRRILERMRADEIRHGRNAEEAGGEPLPEAARSAMRLVSRVMTTTARYI